MKNRLFIRRLQSLLCRVKRFNNEIRLPSNANDMFDIIMFNGSGFTTRYNSINGSPIYIFKWDNFINP